VEFTVEFFEDEDGKIPAQEFLTMLQTQNPTLWKLTIASLNKLKNKQNHGFPLTEYIERDLYTVRSGRDDISRIFFTFLPKRKIKTFNGFVKKGQKIPKTELNKARRYYNMLKGG
jgi:phage-related protein